MSWATRSGLSLNVVVALMANSLLLVCVGVVHDNLTFGDLRLTPVLSVLAGFLAVVIVLVQRRRAGYEPLVAENPDLVSARAARRRMLGKAILWIVSSILVLASAALLGAVSSVAYVASLPERAMAGLDPYAAIGVLVADAAVLFGAFFGVLVSYVMLFFVPFLVAMPLAVLIARGWRNPARILLLRPFHRSSATRLLRLIARRDLAWDGHIYTLSDSTIKVPWYVRVPVFLGQLGFMQFQFRTIRRPKDLERLEVLLDNRWLRNINWALSRSKLFPLKTTDSMWKRSVARLVPRMDLILVDLSSPNVNILWEIEFCRQRDRADRLVCIAPEEDLITVRDLLAEVLSSTPPPLFSYNGLALTDPKRFSNSLAKVLYR